MSEKLSYIPKIESYDFIRNEMKKDLEYRLRSRLDRTSLGRPLYQRINVQLIMTQECPYNCPFCMERKHPMKGLFCSDEQISALKQVLKEHPNARLSITGGEPSLYPDHVKLLVDTFKENGNNVFVSINTAGYDPAINNIANVNLSVNDFVHPELQKDEEIKVKTFRIGDFFVYCTFDYNGKHARVTLGDMYQQTTNDYKDGYSNIIIHPDGRIGLNWN